MKKLLVLFMAGLFILLAGAAGAEVLDIAKAKYINSGKSLWDAATGEFVVKLPGNPWDESLNCGYGVLPNTKYRITIDGNFPDWVTLELKNTPLPTVVYANKVKFRGSGVLIIELTTTSAANDPNARLSLEFGEFVARYQVNSVTIESFQDGTNLLFGDAKGIFKSPDIGNWNPVTGFFLINLKPENAWDASLGWLISLREGLTYHAVIEAYTDVSCVAQVQLKDHENPAQLYAPAQTVQLGAQAVLKFKPIATDTTSRLALNFGGCSAPQSIKFINVKFFAVLADVTLLRAEATHESVKLSWGKVEGATSYEVFWEVQGNWVSIGKIGDVNTAEIKELADGNSYDFMVVSLNEQAQSGGDTIKISTIPWVGDLNGDLAVDLKDALLAMQAMNGLPAQIERKALVGKKLTQQDLIYILQKIAGLR